MKNEVGDQTFNPVQIELSFTNLIGKQMTISYPARDAISVWVGNFKTEMEFDTCVDGPISQMLALKTDMASICEVSYQESPCSIKVLLEGFSGWKSFLDQAINDADMRGLGLANSALVCYYVKCLSAPNRWGQMDFLGTFPVTEVV